MSRTELISFIRQNNKFYEKADLSFYTDEQLLSIYQEITKSKQGRKGM